MSTGEKRGIKVLIHNIGTLVTGDIDKPVLEEDSVLIKDGVIDRMGSYEKLKGEGVGTDIDIQGMTLCPGLIDTHCHIAVSDWTPRMKTVGWIESTVHGGTTTLISEEAAFPGRPGGVLGAKAVAILLTKAYATYRPGGAKVHAGVLYLEEGMTEKDIREMADEGVWLLAEIGGGSLKDMGQIAHLVEVAKECGMIVPIRFGPASIPGTLGYTVEEILKVNPDIMSHINGGPIAASLDDVKLVAEKSSAFLQIVTLGNPKALNDVIGMVRERDELKRIILGSETPSGMAVMPLAMLRTATQISGLNGIPGEIALAMASGNAAIAHRLNTGIIEPGREADLIVIDTPPGSQAKSTLQAMGIGDCPHLGMVMVDGEILLRTSKRSLRPAKNVLVNGQAEPRKSKDEVLFG